MGNQAIISDVLYRLANDSRVTVWHVAIIWAVLQIAAYNVVQPIQISRRKIMQLSHVNSIATYHKCIKDLQIFGLIEYYPSYHPGIKSQILFKTIKPSQ